MEPTATPITDPAMPIFADNRNDVTAANAPAASDVIEMPLKKFLTHRNNSDDSWRLAEPWVKTT